jgi:hypothetical protein
MISTSKLKPFQGFDINFSLTNTKYAYLYAQSYACQSNTKPLADCSRFLTHKNILQICKKTNGIISYKVHSNLALLILICVFTQISNVTGQVLTVVSLKIQVFWDARPADKNTYLSVNMVYYLVQLAYLNLQHIYLPFISSLLTLVSDIPASLLMFYWVQALNSDCFTFCSHCKYALALHIQEVLD